MTNPTTVTDTPQRTLRHTPAGRGHAYRPSLDQRVPPQPAAGDTINLRALADDRLADVTVELDVDGHTTRQPATAPAAHDDGGDAGGDSGSHLAAAAAAGEQIDGMHPVALTVGPYDAGTRLRYRFVADDDTATDWHHVVVADWQTADPAALRLDGPAADRLVGEVEALVADGVTSRLRFAVRLDDHEHVLGLGERFHALDHRGRRVDTQVFEQYKQQDVRTYLPVPFALVVGGNSSWGLHVETTRRCWWDIGATTHDRMVIEVDVDPTDPIAVVAAWTGTPADVLNGFTADTGRPASVPEWVFRPWASGNEWNTQDRVMAEMQRSLDEGIDVGVIVIEAWADEATFTAFRDATYTPKPDGCPMRLEDFTFPADGAWPDPVGMVDWLHDHDIRVLLWQIPLLPVEVPDDRWGAEQLAHDRQALVDGGHAVLEADGTPYRNRGWWFPGALMPDLTSPDARAWWTDKRRYLLDQVGIDGFKTDGGEHAWGDELRYADGTRGADTNNRYPNLYAQTYTDLLADTDTDGVTFSRAGFTGAGTTPCHWAGDEDSTWEAYRASILAGISAGISGISAWGWDHSGFSGPIPGVELYLRSAAMATFCPIMQYHSEFNHHREPCRDRTPWNIAERHGAPEVIDTYRRLTEIRRRLVPYLHEQYHAGAAHGLPLMRALALHWPDDPTIWDYPYQYLLGDDLLVAPVTEPGTDTLEVYLPDDGWTSVWTGAEAGRGLHRVEVERDHVAAFARSSRSDTVNLAGRA